MDLVAHSAAALFIISGRPFSPAPEINTQPIKFLSAAITDALQREVTNKRKQFSGVTRRQNLF